MFVNLKANYRPKRDDTKDTTYMSPMSNGQPESLDKPWRFLTNHSQVLLCIARDPDARMRTIADSVGITERAAQRIVRDLVESGFVTREHIGRRNRYAIDRSVKMRHRAQRDHEIGELLDLLERNES
jgi:predicted transcriptional regulator